MQGKAAAILSGQPDQPAKPKKKKGTQKVRVVELGKKRKHK